MSIECSECERDLRGEHTEGCSLAKRPLKPCPFCGDAPDSLFVGNDDGGYWSIQCRTCNGAGEAGRFAGVHADSQQLAEAAWNHRTK